jgi:ornithine carbamoyltransferase
VLIKPNAALKANEVRVMDTSGRMIFEDTMDRTTYTFDISALAPGAYLVFITYQNGQQHAEKLIVE